MRRKKLLQHENDGDPGEPIKSGWEEHIQIVPQWLSMSSKDIGPHPTPDPEANRQRLVCTPERKHKYQIIAYRKRVYLHANHKINSK